MQEDAAADDPAMQKRIRERYAKMQQAAELEEQKKAVLRNFLAPAAYERVMNVKIANKDLYDQLVNSIAYLVQSGRMAGAKISDEQVVRLLEKMTAKRETSIEFRHK
ncbi:MAG: DNA-binding protein [Candidatus Micrarchaeia archaeon]